MRYSIITLMLKKSWYLHNNSDELAAPLWFRKHKLHCVGRMPWKTANHEFGKHVYDMYMRRHEQLTDLGQTRHIRMADYSFYYTNRKPWKLVIHSDLARWADNWAGWR